MTPSEPAGGWPRGRSSTSHPRTLRRHLNCASVFIAAGGATAVAACLGLFSGAAAGGVVLRRPGHGRRARSARSRSAGRRGPGRGRPSRLRSSSSWWRGSCARIWARWASLSRQVDRTGPGRAAGVHAARPRSAGVLEPKRAGPNRQSSVILDGLLALALVSRRGRHGCSSSSGDPGDGHAAHGDAGDDRLSLGVHLHGRGHADDRVSTRTRSGCRCSRASRRHDADVAGDVVYLFADLQLTDTPAGCWTCPTRSAFIFAGATALHPSMVKLTEVGREHNPSVGRLRIVVVAIALLIPALLTVAGGPASSPSLVLCCSCRDHQPPPC